MLGGHVGLFADIRLQVVPLQGARPPLALPGADAPPRQVDAVDQDGAPEGAGAEDRGATLPLCGPRGVCQTPGRPVGSRVGYVARGENGSRRDLPSSRATPCMSEEGQVNSTLAKKLIEALARIDRPGTFCVSGSAPAVLPGLEVEGLGPVGLPLTARQAKELKKQCEQAPYGKGEETVVDTNVRRVWR